MSSSSSARISISSDEVNLLIYRYLIEAGFKHSAFVFHGESLLHRSPNLVQSDMPPGSLVTLLQKALLFLYVETHVSNDGKQIHCDEPFSLFKPHDHDHGPIETPIQFEESHFGTNHTKRSESLNGDEDARPAKKSKAVSSKQKLDPAIESTTVPDADRTIEEASLEPKVEAVEIPALDSMDFTESTLNEAPTDAVAPVNGSDEPDSNLESSSPLVDN